MIDLTYLRAELVRAQQEGQSLVRVSASELQSVINRLDRHEEHGDKVPKLFGYIISSDLRNLRVGSHMFAKVKRKGTGRFDCPVYFLDMPDQEKPPVPDGVYYDADADYFYSELNGTGMGMAFWEAWRKRKDDFPARPMTAMERQALEDLDDCIPDFSPGSGNRARRRATSLGLSIPVEKT
jgi:hypothetical protein